MTDLRTKTPNRKAFLKRFKPFITEYNNSIENPEEQLHADEGVSFVFITIGSGFMGDYDIGKYRAETNEIVLYYTRQDDLPNAKHILKLLASFALIHSIPVQIVE